MLIVSCVICPTFSSSVICLSKASIFCELSRSGPFARSAFWKNKSLSSRSALTGPLSSVCRRSVLDLFASGTERSSQGETARTANTTITIFIGLVFSFLGRLQMNFAPVFSSILRRYSSNSGSQKIQNDGAFLGQKTTLQKVMFRYHVRLKCMTRYTDDI